MKTGLLSLPTNRLNVGNLRKFGEDIINSLGRDLFHYDNMDEIYFHVLKNIAETRRVKQTPASVKNQLSKVFKALELDSEILLSNGRPLRQKTKIQKEQESLRFFNEYVLGFDKPPKYALDQLKRNVERDLRSLTDLIKHYEGLRSISNFWKKEFGGGSHQDMTQKHFYRRALKLHQEILEYYFEGMYKRALTKSYPHIKRIAKYAYMDQYYDYPYKPIGVNQNCDYRKIDSCGHRILHIYLDEVEDYRKLYISNKEQFYRKLIRAREGMSKIWESIFNNLNEVPIKPGRPAIFAEMYKLHKARKYMAFYALALPQVEGIFAEMIETYSITPGKHALSEKVRRLRKHRDDEELDYFEFSLPDKRNSFAHGGIISPGRIDALEILTDLEYLLAFYASLDNPLIYVMKFVKTKSITGLLTNEGCGSFFMAYEQVKKDQQQYKIYGQEIESFIKEYIFKKLDLISMVAQARFQLQELIPIILMRAKEYFSNYDLLTSKKIPKKTAIPSLTLEDAIENFLHFGETQIIHLFELESFFIGMRCHSKKLDTESLKICQSSFDEFLTYKNVFARVREIGEKAKR